MTEIVIAGAARTPVGSFNGGLSSVSAHYLGQVAIAEAMRRANIDAKEVSEVVMGQILSAGERHKPARHAPLRARTPPEGTGYRHKQLCGPGVRARAAAGSG